MKRFYKEYTIYELEKENEGFFVEVAYDSICDCIDLWLHHRTYGIKMYVVGFLPNELRDIEKFIKNEIDSYIEFYKESYMD